MLPPIQVSQSSVAYQVRRTDDGDLPRQSNGIAGATEEAEPLGLDLRSAIAGRVSILLLSGPERAAESFVIMAELLGRSLGVPRKDGESQVVYMRRLADALNALPPTKRQTVEQQLSQLFNGLSLRTIIAAFADPAGPDAAIMTLHLEVADGDESRRFANSSFLSYQAEQDDAPLQLNASSPSFARAPAKADPLQLHILALSDSSASENNPVSENASRSVSTTRPTIDIRGAQNLTDDTAADGTDNSSASMRVARPFSHVTIEIGGRAQNSGTSDAVASPWQTLRFGDAARTIPPERDEIAATLPQSQTEDKPDGVRADRRPAINWEKMDPSTDQVIPTAAPGGPSSMPPLLRGEEAADDDAFSKFLRASLRSTFEPAMDGERLASPTDATNIKPEEMMRTAANRSGEVVNHLDLRASDPAMVDPVPVEEKPVQVPDLETAPHQITIQRAVAEPIGYPVVGYPYIDDEETDQQPTGKSFQEEGDSNTQDEFDQESSQDDDPDEQSSITAPEDVPSSTFSEPETRTEAAVGGRSIGIDSANDLYWKMAGWA